MVTNMAYVIGRRTPAARKRTNGREKLRGVRPSLAVLVALGALMLPGSAQAMNECGPVNTAANPQTVTCTGAFNPYASGITYDETTFPPASQGNLQVNLSATAAVTTGNTAVTAVGASGKNADIEILTGASVSAGVEGAKSTTTGSGTASITNAGTVAAATIGLDAQSSGGPASVTNAAGGALTVSGANANAGLYAFGTSATVSNAGSVSIDSSAGANDAYGLEATGTAAAGLATVANTGSASVTAGSGTAYGLATGAGNVGAASLTNTGTLTVNGGSGGAYGFTVNGGTDVSASDAATASGAPTTTIGGTGNLTGVSLNNFTGTGTVDFAGASLSLDAAGGSAAGIAVNSGVGDTVTVSESTIGTTTYGADLSVTASSDATGVSIASSAGSANAVSFTGGSLSVTGGSNATGVSIAGGDSASLSFTPGSNAAALTVNSAGGTATGAALSGTGALSADFEDSFNVTNTAGAAFGAEATSGTTQDFTLAKGLTVGATSGSAIGVSSTSGSGLATITSSGPLAVTGSGAGNLVAGIFANADGGLTVGGAPAITASGDDATFGVYGTAIAGPISLTLGNLTVNSTTTSAISAGVQVDGSGAIGVTDAGTISVTGAGSNFGVSASATGGSGDLSLSLGTVKLYGSTSSGTGAGIYVANATTASNTTVSVQSIAAGGQDAIGIDGTSSSTGTATITIGSVSGATRAGGISTTGANGYGVRFATQDGALTVDNNNSLSTSGAGAAGMMLSSSGTGALAVNNWQLATTGANAAGISASAASATTTIASNSVTTAGSSSAAIAVAGGSAAIKVTSATATTGGATSPAISVTSTTGGIAVASTTASTTGKSSAAISASSTTGAIAVTSTTATATGTDSDAIDVTSSAAASDTITLADGGVTSSASGNAINIDTAGSATIKLGSAATTASISGGKWGISSTAAGGSTLALSGTVTGGGGAAIKLSGGADTIVNKGEIDGYVTLSAANDTFTNDGTWNLYGANPDFGGGTNALINAGTIAANPAGTTAQTLSLSGLTTLANSGTLSLQQGASGTAHSGDVLNLGSAAYSGSGSAMLAVDANLGNAAAGSSAAQSADSMDAGSVSGTTTIAVRDLGAGLPGEFNFTGIPVVTAASSTANAFVLQGGAIDKGYVQYRLVQSGADYLLVGLPSEGAFEIARTGAEAGRFWRRSADAWADQMREPGFGAAKGWSFWTQFTGASDTQNSRPHYTVTAQQSFTFSPTLDLRDSWLGGQAGVDYGMGHWGIGLTAGAGRQDGRFRAYGDALDLSGFDVGGYVRMNSGGLFADALAKFDAFRVKQTSHNSAFGARFNGTAYGAELQAGYHAMLGAAFLEPVAALSWSGTTLDRFTSAAAGASVNFGHSDSLFGRIGARMGFTDVYQGWRVTPYAGAYAEDMLSGHDGATVSTGSTSLVFADPRPGANARVELGLSGQSEAGLELSAHVDGEAGGATHGIGGGVALSWHF